MIAAYTILTGASASVVRAALMTSAITLAETIVLLERTALAGDSQPAVDLLL